MNLCLKDGKAMVIAATMPERMHPTIKGKTFSVDQLN